MAVQVDADLCTGCGLCAQVAEEVFAVNDEGLAEVNAAADCQPDSCAAESPCSYCANVQEAIDSCPVEALSWSE
ncbi:MAG TPA: ferredoxin [Armatimonadota bacterium]|jgi:ferredoxin